MIEIKIVLSLDYIMCMVWFGQEQWLTLLNISQVLFWYWHRNLGFTSIKASLPH